MRNRREKSWYHTGFKFVCGSQEAMVPARTHSRHKAEQESRGGPNIGETAPGKALPRVVLFRPLQMSRGIAVQRVSGSEALARADSFFVPGSAQ